MKRSVAIKLFVLVALSPVFAQEDDYASLYERGQYRQALAIIEKKIDDIYSRRVEDKRVPTGFITLRNTDRDIDLMKLFRERKARGFFIEDNSELSALHLYAARCCVKLNKPEDALNHYYQSLRFRTIEYKRDDAVFYEMAQVFREAGHFRAYVSFLETAYELNSDNYDYSRELGRALYTTREKKRAVFHLERYAANAEGQTDPRIVLMIGNLYEDLGRFLDTEKYYVRYLELKADDGYIHFALGHNAYKKTGNYTLARASLARALELLSEKEIIRRSKAHEYRGDMAFSNLDYDEAIADYQETIKYEKHVAGALQAINDEIRRYSEKINELKASLLRQGDFDEYELYEHLKEERARKELERDLVGKDYSLLNSGRVRWFIAEGHERKERYGEAIEYFRQAIAFDYRANDARERIIKLQLKIKRGY
jgi:tetratricopeptide (TPR) repeat protein